MPRFFQSYGKNGGTSRQGTFSVKALPVMTIPCFQSEVLCGFGNADFALTCGTFIISHIVKNSMHLQKKYKFV